MKILISSDLYWPTINGVSTAARTLAHGLAEQGHEVLVIAPSQTGKKYRETDGKTTVARCASVPFFFYQNFRICITPYLEVKKIIKNFQPDVIHLMGFLMICQATMRYGQKCDIPIVSTNHAMPENLMDNLKRLAPLSRPINYVMKDYIVRFHQKTDYFTMPTQSALDIFKLSTKKLKIPVEAVSNGIDLSRFSVGKTSKEVMEKFKIPTDKPIVSYVGRVDTEKHLPVLIDAFNRLVKEHDAHLLIVGKGTELDNLQNYVKRLKIDDKVTLTGGVTDNELVELHRAGDVFVMPSPVELQSIVMLESMACGKPMVAVDAGPLKELCQNGRNGILCEVDNDKQIADALSKIISDPDLRKRFGHESVKIAATHDLKKTIERYEEIYESVIAKRRTAR
jgi:glycosyltransferase involved in cell wall biosynthesis